MVEAEAEVDEWEREEVEGRWVEADIAESCRV